MNPPRMAHVAELWRYPVKSMRGQPCSTLSLDVSGILGDRRFALTSSRAPIGKPLLASDERAAMLLYQPHVAEDGGITVTTPGHGSFHLRDPALLRHIEAALHQPTHLRLLESPHALTDVRPIALHSLQTARQLAAETPTPAQADPRRLRSNIVLDLANNLPFAEDALVGQSLQIGKTARLRILERIPRCRIVALDPETAVCDRTLLTAIAHHHQGRTGIYAAVLVPGQIHIGDTVIPV